MRVVCSNAGRRWTLLSSILLLAAASVLLVRVDRTGVPKSEKVESDLLPQYDYVRYEDEELGREQTLNDVPNVSGINHARRDRTNPFNRKDIDRCPSPKTNAVRSTFDVNEMHSSLTTDDLDWDGDVGVWDDKWEKEYQTKQKKSNGTLMKNGFPLKVVIVPFSHSDPGWLMSIDEYYKGSTNSTLNLVLERLQAWPDMTFVWAETSFFRIWWDEQDDNNKDRVRKLIKDGRLEMINGGEVMPDEANCHYYAIIHQYIYGHQWLLRNLKATPKHGFSIDPFGYSATMAYLLKNLGFDSMYIQRIHYIIRKRLVQAGASQFHWIQPWDTDNSDSMFCYMSHTHLYDIRHTCGVETSVCQGYDYSMIMGGWNETIPEPAENLLIQFKKAVTFYPHNTLLFPLGMDFKWTTSFEWEAKYYNYKEIAKYLHKKYPGQLDIQFGTYKNYYDEVFKRMKKTEGRKNLPTVSGDFFPYADKTIEYWTGYFTSHPFHKALSRDLENHLRSAEILYSSALLRSHKLDAVNLLRSFSSTAKNLGLFQHHDAIAGTSRQAVMDDYERRLFQSVEDMYAVIQYIATTMLWPNDVQHELLDIHDKRASNGTKLPSTKLLGLLQSPHRIVVFNSVASSRGSVIDLHVDTENVVIENSAGELVDYQISPCFDSLLADQERITNCSRLTFFASFDSIQFQTFVVRTVTAETAAKSGQKRSKVIDTESSSWRMDEPLIIQNKFLQATFSQSNGLLTSLIEKNGGAKRSIRQEWKQYNTERSGAYLFWPNGISDVQPYPHEEQFIDGPLFSELRTKVLSENSALLTQVVRIFRSNSELDAALHVETTHNIVSLSNAEIVMRLTTDIQNNFTLFTDSNGFQMMRRRASHALPMQANYYPATTMAFLQDQNSRLTMHLSQAHGIGSQDTGQIEVMLDRVLSQDDSRGVEESLRPTHTVRTTMKIQLENTAFCRACRNPDPTSSANAINLHLNNPTIVLTGKLEPNETTPDLSGRLLFPALPCDAHLVLLKPVDYEVNSALGIIFHKFGVDCSSKGHESKCRNDDGISLPKFVDSPNMKIFNTTTLNFVENHKKSKSTDRLQLTRKKLVAVKFDL